MQLNSELFLEEVPLAGRGEKYLEDGSRLLIIYEAEK